MRTKEESPASRLFKGSRNAENPLFAGFIRAHKEKGSAQTVLPLCSLFCLVRAPGGPICPGVVPRHSLINGTVDKAVHAFPLGLCVGFEDFTPSFRHGYIDSVIVGFHVFIYRCLLCF